MKRFIAKAGHFFNEIFISWKKNKTEQMAAALSFYALLSLPSLVILLLTLGSYFYSPEEIKMRVIVFLTQNFSKETSLAFSEIINAAIAYHQRTSVTIVSILLLFLTSSLFFSHLVASLHTLWKIQTNNKHKIQEILINNLLAFIFIIFIEGIIISSIVLQMLIGSLNILFSVRVLINFSLLFIVPFCLFLFIFNERSENLGQLAAEMDSGAWCIV